MSATESVRETTTIQVTRSLHSRLEGIKPYDSMSFNELIEELADVYEERQEQEP